MTDADFPEELCLLIKDAIPTIEAAGLLVVLARDPGKQWKAEEIVHEIRPTVIAESEVRKCLVLFQARGLVIENQNARFQYRPASAALDSTAKALAKAYTERPVTLIRLIYARNIQSFADAFKIRTD